MKEMNNTLTHIHTQNIPNVLITTTTTTAKKTNRIYINKTIIIIITDIHEAKCVYYAT